jgi:cytochrome P450
MEQEKDINNIIAAINGRLFYNSIIGQVPSLHRFLFGNRVVAKLASFIPSIAILNSSRYIVDFTAQQLKRYQNQEFNTVECQDMLARFKRFKDGELVMSESELLSHTSGNIFAGSDTTAASMRSIFYNLCRTPTAYKKLLSEIDDADSNGRLSDPVTFAEAQELKYLQAVIKEALRMHPAVGLILERIVPDGGFDLPNGVHLPAGTIIGMNPWVAARDPETYSPDPYIFRPERWLDVNEEKLKVMERNFLAFGSGSRTCLGKNVSHLEMSKLVPQVLRRFEFELKDPDKEWILEDYWFVQQRGLVCRVKRRGS